MGGRQSGTVVQAARERYRQRIREHLERGDASFYPTLVNRLDVPTSGIVLIALTREVHRVFQAMSAARRIEKEYVALVRGVVAEEDGLIDMPIGPCAGSRVRLKMGCRPDGKESRTRFQVIERFPAHTLLRAFPVTGRQHQLRVHLAGIGHPVAGDLLYTDEAMFLEAVRAGPLPRLCLHARRTSFSHPVSGRDLTIEAPIPPELEQAIQEARSGRTGPGP
jgi:RluA family pseudouridine synthase